MVFVRHDAGDFISQGLLSQDEPDPTTRRLLELAAEEFTERGFEATRVADIARRAGLTSGAVYGRWRNKPEVLAAALEYTFERILPERVVKQSPSDGLRPPDLIALLAATLHPDTGHQDTAGHRDVLVHVFGGARNNELIAACLKDFINRESDQISSIIEEGKEAGFCDPGLSTAAISLMCQAVGIGVHLVMSAGLDEHRVPSADDWNELIAGMVGSAAPPASTDP